MGLVETLSKVVLVSLSQPGSLVDGVVESHDGAGGGPPQDGQLDEIDQVVGQRGQRFSEPGDQGQVVEEHARGQLQERQVGLTVNGDLKTKKHRPCKICPVKNTRRASTSSF